MNKLKKESKYIIGTLKKKSKRFSSFIEFRREKRLIEKSKKRVDTMGIEPMASAMRTQRSTTELSTRIKLYRFNFGFSLFKFTYTFQPKKKKKKKNFKVGHLLIHYAHK